MPVRFGKGAKQQSAHGFLSLFGPVVLILSLAFPQTLWACPGLLLGQHLPLRQKTTARADLRLFSLKDGLWQAMPMQLDPLDKEGSLQFPDYKAWIQDRVANTDRLSLRVEDFAQRLSPRTKLPCQAQDLIELEYRGRYAYLLACKGAEPAAFSNPVSLDEKARTLQSQQYRYRYTKKNHLVFEDILLTDGEGKDFVSVAKESDLLIVGDVKNFFTLGFDADDIEATIKDKRSGPLGLMGGLEFYLRILAFRINMELRPEANFFDDALFMPMSMTLPVNAAKYLRRGSGIYYSWFTDKDAQWDWNDSQIDELDLEHLDPESKSPLIRPNPHYCDSRFCRYRLSGQVKNRRFVMNFVINRQAANLGFFPQLIRDVPAAEKRINRPLSRYPATGRMAIFFETARLPQGTHTWDFWISFPQKDTSGECRLQIRRKNLSHLIPVNGL